MSELKHDPELPFAFLDTTGSEVYARFKHRSDAEVFRERCNFGRVVDTTPKPKIPEDAEYIMWQLDGEIQMAYKGGGSYDWYGNTEAWTHEQLLEEVADGEVTILVRKEES